MPMLSTESAAAPIAEEEVPATKLLVGAVALPVAALGTKPDGNISAAEVDVPVPVGIEEATSQNTSNPYRTDVYPDNVYSEELIYDADGNLIGKTTTYPTAFDPDTIWIDGHACYDVPGFGLIEWSGPSSVTEDYTMYENGNKVGIMGGEDEAPARTSTQPKPEDWPEPTGEVIDQSINAVPEKSGTPPEYKPDTTPPDDPNARIMD